MKRMQLLFIAISCLLVACNDKSNVDNVEPITQNVMRKVPTPFLFTLTESEQDKIAAEFAQLCSDTYFLATSTKNLDFDDTEPFVNIAFRKDDLEESKCFVDGLSIAQSIQSNNKLLEYLNTSCANNYLTLHAYIPYWQKNLSSSKLIEEEIYIVNALYQKALGSDIKNFRYKASYVISKGAVNPSDMIIDEEFAQNHITCILSFRDYIANWEHFGIGSQSISDPLIRSFVSFVGNGCQSYEQVEKVIDEYYPSSKYGIIFEIKYGKRFLKNPCRDIYNHFCRLKPINKPSDTYNIDLEIFKEEDPYHVSWSPFEKEKDIQVIKVIDNPLALDLAGYIFPIEEQILHLDKTTIFIPKQLCTYSSTFNGLTFKAYEK